MSADDSAILTIDELAGYLKIPKSTLYKLAQDGRIPGQKVGRHWRFRRDVIDRWLEQGSIAADPERQGER
jgi:excisionase family DNA binding protein